MLGQWENLRNAVFPPTLRSLGFLYLVFNTEFGDQEDDGMFSLFHLNNSAAPPSS